jgi:hypothetical protein
MSVLEVAMRKIGLVLPALALLASCGGPEEDASGLTADERQRLENIAERLDEDSREVREMLEADAAVPEENESAGPGPGG